LEDDVEISTPAFLNKLKEMGVLIMDVGPREFRLVTHLDTKDEAVEQCINAFETILK
jgi:threonine aldolase